MNSSSWLLLPIAVLSLVSGPVIVYAADQEIVVPPGETLTPDANWIGGNDVNLTLEKGSTLMLRPSQNNNVWRITLKSLTIEQDVKIDVSGKDMSVEPAPPKPPTALSGPAEGNGFPGYPGTQGFQGGPTVEAILDVGTLKIGSVAIVRHGGNGGTGGEGGNGGQGGAGSALHKSGSGGEPGKGGQGGRGGDVRPFTVIYTTFVPTSGNPPPGSLLPGATDDQIPGKGGAPGVGGVSSAGSGTPPAGSGSDYDYRAQNNGYGADGKIGTPVEFRKR